jgi:hypothetical protein
MSYSRGKAAKPATRHRRKPVAGAVVDDKQTLEVRLTAALEHLNYKQQRFVAEYLADLNATQADIRAGYSRNSARQQVAISCLIRIFLMLFTYNSAITLHKE